ncbi:Hypothetical predicted protein [Marmota monax]|uniref:Ig-like domain-containing protein n=1 Tax=Marmota monax TaxID=9995 RepID=A0A5E4ARX3_MARMO|nr:hypothetical protein GHT09_000236 [Marmota monax]VTJ59516.1 Hypothetical predicted protein [Marmota monax]
MNCTLVNQGLSGSLHLTRGVMGLQGAAHTTIQAHWHQKSDISDVMADAPNREKGGAKSLLSAQETSTLSAKMLRPVLPDPAWGPRLLYCFTLCLLGAGSVDAEVILSPRHLIRAKGGKGTLKCYPMSGHRSVSWYQQAPGQGPQFFVEYFDKLQRNKGNLPDRFSAQQFDDYHSELNMSSLELGDSAMYLCASSLHSPEEPLAFCTLTFLSQLRVF